MTLNAHASIMHLENLNILEKSIKQHKNIAGLYQYMGQVLHLKLYYKN